ncbi:MAG: DUF1573 domain-containing protein, partial [Planctomycetaceae bacterium]
MMAPGQRHAALISALVLTVCLLGPWGPASAQAQSTRWAEEMFEKDIVDFGVIARGSDAVLRLKLTNKYKETVHISGVRTTCGCSAATPSDTTLDSRETAYIEVTMDTRRHTRLKTSNLVVTFDAPYPAEVRIPIKAYIRTDVVFTPGGVDFGVVDHGQPATRTIDVAYAGRADWTIKDVQTHNEYLEAAVKETRRENGRVNYALTVTVAASAPVGVLRQQITLVTDDQSSPHVPLLVEGRVE